MKKKDKKDDYITISYRKLGLLLGIIFLIGLTVVAFPKINQKLNPTYDATKNWETHTYSNYLFKYPATEGWESYPITSPLGATGVKCKSNCQNSSIIFFEVSSIIYTTLDEYKKRVSENEYLTDIQNTTVNGEPAIRGAQAAILRGGSCCSMIKYFVVHKGRGYEISLGFPILNLSKISQFPAPNPDILSTFKFID